MPEPVSLNQARAHLRVLHDDEDDLISSIIVTAREQVEADTELVIMPRRVTEAFYGFKSPLVLRKCWPIAATPNLAVAYTDLAGASQTVTGAQLFTSTWPAKVMPAINTNFPQAFRQPESVRVSIDCGYAEDAVPAALVQAMLLLIGHWFANREAYASGQVGEEIELGYHALIARPSRHIIG